MTEALVFRTGPYKRGMTNHRFPSFPATEATLNACRLPDEWGFVLKPGATGPQRPLLALEATPPGALMTTTYLDRDLVGYIAYHWEKTAHLVRIHQLGAEPRLAMELGPLLLAKAQDYTKEVAARGVYMKPFTRQTGIIQLLKRAGYQLWGVEQGLDADRSSIQMGRANPHAIPTRRLCHELLRAYGIPPGIIHHSLLTEKVTSLLAQGLEEEGITLDTRLISAGALLHDIGKGQDARRHHTASRRIVEQEGYPRLGRIVERHLTTFILTAQAPSSWEEKLVCYADKVCTHEVVSLSERFRDLGQRYQEQAPAIGRALPPFLRLEEEIFSHLPWSPQELPRLLQTRPPTPTRPSYPR